jgi:selenocysteine-specific elongation factor
VRVRGIQVHGQTADAAVAGQRTALNLSGASTEELSRGMRLAPANTFELTRRADVWFRLLPSAARPLKNRARVHFHSYTMETVAEVVPHDAKQIVPGDAAFARLKLPQEALLLPGDRFIIRQFSPIVTIGGGVVLDASPILRMANPAGFLKVLKEGSAESIVQARIAHRHQQGISMRQLIAETGWAINTIEPPLTKLVTASVVTRAGDVLIDSQAFETLKSKVVTATQDFHKSNSLAPGIGKEELRSQLQASTGIFEFVVAALIRERKVDLAGDLVRLPGRGVVMKDEEAEAKTKIEHAFASAGLKVPGLQDVLAGLPIDKARAQKLVTLLLREKALVKISDQLVFHRTALEELRRQLSGFKAKSPAIGVAQFKELTGVSRKYAIPLLEYLDREHVTKRVGDAREIL